MEVGATEDEEAVSTEEVSAEEARTAVVVVASEEEGRTLIPVLGMVAADFSPVRGPMTGPCDPQRFTVGEEPVDSPAYF